VEHINQQSVACVTYCPADYKPDWRGITVITKSKQNNTAEY